MNTGERFAILVVEDEPLLRMDLSDELRSQFEVIEATNADEALAVLRSGMKVDLVCTDVQMPGTLDGLQLARLIDAEFPYMVVSVTSGSSDALAVARSFVRPELVFSKPYDPRDLASVFNEVLGPGQSSSGEYVG